MPLNHHYLWNTRFLKSELSAHAISEGKLFLYFFAITGFDWLQFTFIRLSSTSGAMQDWEYANALSPLFITIIGLLFLFLFNGGVHGKDFLYRYFPLSFVVGWKFMVAATIAIWVTGLVMKNEPVYLVGWISMLIFTVFNIAMFLRIGFHLREVAQANLA